MAMNFNRKRFGYGAQPLLTRDVLRAAPALDFPSVAAGASQTLTVTVKGAAVGDDVVVTRRGAPVQDALITHGWVSAADTVSVRVRNNTAGALDPTSETYGVIVFKQF